MASIINYAMIRAAARVTLYEVGAPRNQLQCLLNPQSLSISVTVGIGKQYPIGATHSNKQYSHTEDPVIPLEFYVSRQFANRLGNPVGVEETQRWLTQFCYLKGIGVSPPKVALVWPNILAMRVVVESVNVEYTRFQDDLSARAARIQVQYSEERNTMKTSSEHKRSGWINSSVSTKSILDNASGNSSAKPAWDRTLEELGS